MQLGKSDRSVFLRQCCLNTAIKTGHMRHQRIALIESAYNAPIQEILNAFIDEGITKQTAATRLGIAKNTLYRWIEMTGVKWPTHTREHRQRREQTLSKRTRYRVVHQGEVKPLFEAAKAENLPYNVVLDRYKRGKRGEALYRPVSEYRLPPERYDFQLSEDDWALVLEIAEDIGTKRAAQKFEIPMSVVTLAQKGQLNTLTLTAS